MNGKKQKYVNNKQFQVLLVDYFDRTELEQNKKSRKKRIWKSNPPTKDDLKLFEKLGFIFIKISENVLRRVNFVNYSQDRKDAMISDATFYMTKYIGSYKTEKANPFAWFSQVAFNAFKQNINKENKRKTMFISLDFLENFGPDTEGIIDE